MENLKKIGEVLFCIALVVLLIYLEIRHQIFNWNMIKDVYEAIKMFIQSLL